MYLIKAKHGLNWFHENCGKIAELRSFHGRSFEIDRSVGRQKSTATDRLRTLFSPKPLVVVERL